jgi:hypothetical protein
MHIAVLLWLEDRSSSTLALRRLRCVGLDDSARGLL